MVPWAFSSRVLQHPTLAVLLGLPAARAGSLAVGNPEPARPSQVDRVTSAAREGRATRDELSGSTITLTSLGTLGGIVSTPVINHPEVAIVNPNKIVERPIVQGHFVTVRKMMNLSSAFDHRIVDGYDAALFIQRLKQCLEHPALIFMH